MFQIDMGQEILKWPEDPGNICPPADNSPGPDG